MKKIKLPSANMFYSNPAKAQEQILKYQKRLREKLRNLEYKIKFLS